jgi:hypothetical protein
MTTNPRPPHFLRWTWLAVVAVVTAAAGLVAVFAASWWAWLPLLAFWGGLVGIRWRWLLAPITGFVLGLGVWAGELLLLPTDPRTALASALGPAEGVSGSVFLLLGPLLFGLTVAVGAAAFAGGVRWARESRGGPAIGEPSP